MVMERSIDVANYLSSISNRPQTFIEFNGHKMNSRDYCISEIMYLANIFHKLIFDDFIVPTSDFEAWTNGPINNVFREKNNLESTSLSYQIKEFLNKIENYFSEFKPEELYTITHWDPAFIDAEESCVMKTENYVETYKNEFKNSVRDFLKTYNLKSAIIF
jgi:hypothetical protein